MANLLTYNFWMAILALLCFGASFIFGPPALFAMLCVFVVQGVTSVVYILFRIFGG